MREDRKSVIHGQIGNEIRRKKRESYAEFRRFPEGFRLWFFLRAERVCECQVGYQMG